RPEVAVPPGPRAVDAAGPTGLPADKVPAGVGVGARLRRGEDVVVADLVGIDAVRPARLGDREQVVVAVALPQRGIVALRRIGSADTLVDCHRAVAQRPERTRRVGRIERVAPRPAPEIRLGRTLPDPELVLAGLGGDDVVAVATLADVEDVAVRGVHAVGLDETDGAEVRRRVLQDEVAARPVEPGVAASRPRRTVALAGLLQVD